MNESDLATDAEIKQAIAEGQAEGRRKALADRAAAEIMEGESQGVTSLVDLYDHEILRIEGVVRKLNEKLESANTHDRDALDREIRERFAEVNLEVDVVWYFSDVPGVYIPEINIIKRIEGLEEFDQERQAHEVTNDLLELGDKGTIGPGGLWTPG